MHLLPPPIHVYGALLKHRHKFTCSVSTHRISVHIYSTTIHRLYLDSCPYTTHVRSSNHLAVYTIAAVFVFHASSLILYRLLLPLLPERGGLGGRSPPSSSRSRQPAKHRGTRTIPGNTRHSAPVCPVRTSEGCARTFGDVRAIAALRAHLNFDPT